MRGFGKLVSVVQGVMAASGGQPSVPTVTPLNLLAYAAEAS